MLANGNYKVTKIVDCLFGISKSETPFFAIELKLETGDEMHWVVNLHNKLSDPKAEEMAKKTMDNLVKLGFKGSRLEDMAEGTVEDLFDEIDFSDVSVTVEQETYEGKTRAKIKFLNIGSSFNRVDKKQAVVVMKSLPYNSWFVQAKKNVSPKLVEKKSASDFTSEDVPF